MDKDIRDHRPCLYFLLIVCFHYILFITRMVMCATNDGSCLREGDVGGPLVLMENGRYVVAGVAQR